MESDSSQQIARCAEFVLNLPPQAEGPRRAERHRADGGFVRILPAVASVLCLYFCTSQPGAPFERPLSAHRVGSPPSVFEREREWNEDF
jgi:hypothetical protein